ncbi:CDP-alcohol phosphatidyltransferase family protein [Asanoa siamensis]|uniref:CDP-alcohol phosphatidyltransferase family protein n=1 Tax=Asanoa siamensis TaxID=926357 RepID=UPI001EF2DC75|nr:CDP-alcohol phosphatidyltransferase family protein [Asanoa siamensis]
MYTIPNLVTAVRTIAAVSLAAAALVHRSVPLVAAAFAIYWIGDMLDGLAARILRQETRFGAVLDILSDRACCSLCVAVVIVLRPDMAFPLALFLLQFMVLDCQLSLSFLRWPIVSPNYFYVVHRAVYLWNWSPPAKAVNTSALVVLVLLAPSPLYPLALALAVTAVKVISLVTVSRLREAGPHFA